MQCRRLCRHCAPLHPTAQVLLKADRSQSRSAARLPVAGSRRLAEFAVRPHIQQTAPAPLSPITAQPAAQQPTFLILKVRGQERTALMLRTICCRRCGFSRQADPAPLLRNGAGRHIPRGTSTEREGESECRKRETQQIQGIRQLVRCQASSIPPAVPNSVHADPLTHPPTPHTPHTTRPINHTPTHSFPSTQPCMAHPPTWATPTIRQPTQPTTCSRHPPTAHPHTMSMGHPKLQSTKSTWHCSSTSWAQRAMLSG